MPHRTDTWLPLHLLLVGAGLALLAVILFRIRRTSQVDRFDPAIEAYLVAVGLGLLGVALGAVIAAGSPGEWWGRLRVAHLPNGPPTP